MKRIIFLIVVFVISCEENIESDYIEPTDIGYDCEEIQSYYQESIEPIMSNH